MPFTDETWQTPESDLDTNAYCSVCIVDLNPAGQDKIKANCYLPVRKTPGGPYNRNALRNAAARLPRTQIPMAAKRAAARKLVRLMREGGIEPGEITLRMAGME
jgi:hypothetical protein